MDSSKSCFIITQSYNLIIITLAISGMLHGTDSIKETETNTKASLDVIKVNSDTTQDNKTKQKHVRNLFIWL